MADIVLKDRDGKPITHEGVTAMNVLLVDGTTKLFTAGGGGDLFINHMNDDGSELLYAKPIMYGDTAGDAIALGMMEEPYKENTETTDYTFLGWTDSIGGEVKTTMFENVTEDRTVYAAFKSTAIVASGECGETATWKLDEDGCLTISGTGGMTNFGASNQPWLDYASTIKSVVVNDGITTIGNYAFYNRFTGITSVTIPDSVTSIGAHAFNGCTSLTSVTIPASVTSMNNGVFSHCTSLTSVTIPASVTSMGAEVFRMCTSLVAINVATDNAYYCSVDGVLYTADMTKIICYPVKKTGTTFAIPSGITIISVAAFEACTNLKSVSIPDSVTTIENAAFNNCTSLTSIVIPANVTSMSSAFSGCTNLTSATFKVTSGWKASMFFGGTYTLSSSSLANTSTAANYLRNTYATYTWTRT